MIRAILPLSLIAYFVYRAQHRKIFWLGVPFVMFVGSAVFFEQIPRLPLLNKVLYQADNNQLILATMGIIWLICCGLPKYFGITHQVNLGPFGANRLFLEEIPWILIGTTIILSLLFTPSFLYSFGSAGNMALEFSYLGIGYVLVRGIISYSSRQDMIGFLNSLVWVNTIAAILYILHQGLHLPIYQGNEYFTTFFLGQVITRTFWFMPPLLLFSIVFQASKPRLNWVTLIIIGINFLAVLISYTRFLIILGVLLIFLPALLRGLKGQHKVVIRQLVVIGVLGALFIGVIQQFLSVESQYLLERINSLSQMGQNSDANSFEIRQGYTQRTWDMLQGSEIYIGAGFSIENEDSRVYYIDQWRADVVWISILFHLGVVGVIGFAGLLFLGLLKSWQLFWRSFAEREFLGLVFFSYLLAVVVEGFFSSSFMYWIHYPLGLWYLAFLSVEANRNQPKLAKTVSVP
jgi:hypothetical protein